MYTRNKAFTFPLSIAKDLWQEAIKVARDVRVDQLDRGGLKRTRTNKSVDEVIDIILNSRDPHLVFIERQPLFVNTDPYYDIGGCTMCLRPADYFLWIEVSIPEAEQLVKKYKLKQTQ